MKSALKLFLLFIFLQNNLFAQNWQWAKQIGSNCSGSPERFTSFFSDGTNCYGIGQFWGCLYLPNDTLHSNGNMDNFIVKFDKDGNEVWAKKWGGNYTQFDHFEYAYGAYDPVTNSIFISGSAFRSTQFDTITMNASSINEDIYLARMDLNGHFLWAKLFSGAGFDFAQLFINPAGKIYLVTQSSDSISFDTHRVPSGCSLVQFDSSGLCTRAIYQFNESGSTLAQIKFMGNDLLFYGIFGGPNPFQFDSITRIPKGSADGFIARADSNGRVKWFKSIANTGYDRVQNVGIDSLDNIYLTGEFTDTLNLNSNYLYHNGFDLFICKLDSSGNLIWQKNTNADSSAIASIDINVEGNGKFYLTGYYTGTITFGNQSEITSNSSDAFLCRFDANGYMIGFNSASNSSGMFLAKDSLGSIYNSGWITQNAVFNSTTLSSYGGYDIYVAKHDAITEIPESPERLANNSLLIYANPNEGICTIKIPEELKNATKLNLKIVDSNSKLVQETNFSLVNGKLTINITDEAKGIYTAIISDGNRKYTGKIIFE